MLIFVDRALLSPEKSEAAASNPNHCEPTLKHPVLARREPSTSHLLEYTLLLLFRATVRTMLMMMMMMMMVRGDDDGDDDMICTIAVSVNIGFHPLSTHLYPKPLPDDT